MVEKIFNQFWLKCVLNASWQWW